MTTHKIRTVFGGTVEMAEREIQKAARGCQLIRTTAGTVYHIDNLLLNAKTV